MLFLSVELVKEGTVMEITTAILTRRLCGVVKPVAKIDRDAIPHDVGCRSFKSRIRMVLGID